MIFLQKYRNILLIGLFFHLLASIFSVGQLQADEHFQILEFLGTKLAIGSTNDLPWEYQEKMRPWIQPGFYYLIVKLQSFLGITDRFFWVFTFRLFSSFIGYFSLVYFALTLIKSYKRDFIKDTSIKWLLALSTLLWFYPFMHARISSEGLGTSFFFIGLSLYLQSNKKKVYLFSGLILGISFVIRYHIGILLAALILHQLILKKEKLLSIIILIIGILSSVALSLIIDHWGYGNLVIAPYEYFMQNLVHKKAAGFGVSPWYEYFLSINKKSIFPFGPIIIASFIYFWVKRPKHLFTWLSCSFIVLHSAIGHKEWRFLFPLAPFVPYFTLNLLTSLNRSFPLISYISIKSKIIKIVIGLNFTLLVVASCRPIHPSYNFFKETQNITPKIDHLYYLANESPFNLYQLKQSFFDYHRPKLHQLKDIQELENINKDFFWVFTDRMNKIDPIIKQYPYCQFRYSNYPLWFINSIGKKIMKRSKVWTLYACKKTQSNF